MPLTVTVSLVAIVPVVTTNGALVCPLRMVALAGVVNWPELSESVTTVEPTAALFRFTEQVLVWLLLSDPFGHAMLVSTGAVVRERFADCVPPFRLAVMVTLSSAGTPVTVAVN